MVTRLAGPRGRCQRGSGTQATAEESELWLHACGVLDDLKERASRESGLGPATLWAWGGSRTLSKNWAMSPPLLRRQLNWHRQNRLEVATGARQ